MSPYRCAVGDYTPVLGYGKLLIYQAFIEQDSGFPKHLASRVHELYFQPVH